MEGKRKVSTNFSPTACCISHLHSEANLTCSSVPSWPTKASLFLLGRAAVAIGLHLPRGSSTLVLHCISLGHWSSIEKHFQCIPLKDLPTAHLVGVYFFFFFFLLSFFYAEQEGRFYFFYYLLNFSVNYLAIAQGLFRNELLKEIK